MRKNRSMSWTLGLAAAGVLALPAGLGSAQTQVVTDADALATGRTQTVVVTQRPLRTFRGQTVRVGRFAEAERAIGVVRPLRPIPNVYGDTGYRGSSSYFYDRYPRVEREIGVVRPFVTYDPPVYNPPTTFTNPNAAASPSTRPAASETPRVSAPLRPVLSDDIEVTAVETVEVPADHRDDPWALLNHGFYREARQQFALLGTGQDADLRTGHALAAALSGDLPGGAALMPDEPALPEGVVFRAATTQRLEQTRHYLYAGQPAMQAKLQVVLDAVATPAVSAR